MLGSTGSENGRCRRALKAIAPLLLVALFVALILPSCGCGEKTVTLDDDEEQTETDGMLEEETSDSEEVDEDLGLLGEEDGEGVELGWEYTNENYSFSISYPEDWESEELGEGVFDGCRIVNPSNATWQVLAYAYDSTGNTLEEQFDEYLLAMESSAGEVDREQPEPLTGTYLGGEYISDGLTYYVEGMRIKEAVLIMEKDGVFFEVAAKYPLDQAEEAGPYMAAILQSFAPPE